MAVFIAFDVDGTLNPAGGPVYIDDIKKFLAKNPENQWGIVSSRSVQRSREVIPEDLECEHVIVCRVDMRAEELIRLRRFVKEDKPYQFEKFVYVADRQVDGEEARRAGWIFVMAKNFTRYLSLMG